MGEKIFNMANNPKFKYFTDLDDHMMNFDDKLINEIDLFINKLNQFFLTFNKINKPIKRRIIAEENPIL